MCHMMSTLTMNPVVANSIKEITGTYGRTLTRVCDSRIEVLLLYSSTCSISPDAILEMLLKTMSMSLAGCQTEDR